MYRSPVARYLLSALGITAGLVFALGDPDKWQSAPSLHFLGQVPFLPLDFWGWLGVAYGLMLLHSATRTIGYATGAFLFAVISVCLITTLNSPGPKNIFGLIGVVDAVVYHLLAIGFAALDRDVKKHSGTP